MSVDLSQYLDQEVLVTYENGDIDTGRVTKYTHVNEDSKLTYSIEDKDGLVSTYTKGGFVWSHQGPHPFNIVEIEPIAMKKYEQIEEQVKTLWEEVKKLQEEIGHLKKEEKKTKLPEGFYRESAIAFLESPSSGKLDQAFTWSKTPQGTDYWREISSSLRNDSSYKVPQGAIVTIQSWIIESYKEKHGV